jgi:glycosyltransferase involved in cell wall biosynthesis
VRVLIVSQYFEPEVTAASLRLAPIAAGLAERGHQVEVLCEVPNHPRGVVEDDFRGRPVVKRHADGYQVRHVWVRASPSKRARARLASYATFAASALTVGSALKRPDVVFASSPPLSVGVAGSLLATRHRAPLVLDVRDLWPQIALALGELEPGRVATAAERTERGLYRRAAAVTTPTEPFRSHIAALAGDPEKVHLLSNGTTREWLAAGELPADREGAGLPADRFVLTYAGNLGLSQELEVAIEVARTLGEGFQLLLLGDGTSRPRLEQLAADLAGREVAFRDSVPASEAMLVMRASDALLVSLADLPELGRTVPVKLYDSCAIGRPVILAAPGEARRLAERAGAAIVVEPGDPAGLAGAVRALRDDPRRADEVVTAGRAFAAANLRESGVEGLERLLRSVAGGGSTE